MDERVIPIEELWQHDYALIDISVFEQNWRAKDIIIILRIRAGKTDFA